MKIKLKRQLDVADCGAACLQMIAGYYGRKISLISIKDKIFVSRYGVSLLNVARGAESLGFHAINAKLSLDYLKKNKPFPCILHINDEHFVILHSITKKIFSKIYYYHLADPAYGLTKLDEGEFSRSWLVGGTGVAMILTPKEGKSIIVSESNEPKYSKALFKYFYSFKKYFFQLIVGLLGASLISFILPFLAQLIVDEGIASENIALIGVILVAQVILLFGQLVINFIRSWLLMHINVRISINIISDFLSKLMRIPIKFFDAKSQGDIIQRIYDHSVVEKFLTNGMLNTLFSILNIIVFSVILGIYGFTYLLLFWMGSLGSIMWIWAFNKKRKQINYIRFQRNRENQDSMFEILNGMTEIKLNNNDLQRRWEWEKTQARLFKLNLSNLKLEQIQNFGNFFINQLKNVIILFFAAKAVVDTSITIGMMMSISYIVGALNSPLEQLSGFIQSLQDAKLSMGRLMELQTVKDEYDSDTLIKDVNIDSKTDIVLENVTFSYEGSSTKLILDKLDFTIEGGKTTAIVGPSGCGKTTLIKLLLNYYQPLSGSILVNEVEVKNLPLREWRDKIGCVLQDGYIFTDTVLNNIIMKNEVDNEWLQYALKISNCEDFVYNLPFGINTKIGSSGLNLSAGQKQRILIARAVYKNPEIIIFDEATSALDTKNEAEISNKLQLFFKKRTAIIIAHRLSTVKNADIIYVINNGKVIEAGNHSTLVKRKGYYYSLIQNQLELE